MTKLLPAWHDRLLQLKLLDENMPQDVRTCWNSTYEMLQFMLEYRDTIDSLTGDRATDLRWLELRDEEWKIVAQLCDVLKVRHTLLLSGHHSLTHISDILGWYAVLLTRGPQPRHGHPGNGRARRASHRLLAQGKCPTVNPRCHRPCQENP